ncbi:lytic transglycosylase domain-containing protein [Beijerinckia sp. L45]|uniref:lytic transglycosylase domain-containing protein n=1 Tax=Beijerinckia sp. L45 TaxID=1641855 RepID=UPI001FEEFFE8|nr:lytic transglycosylase domain-containing protein [Beijerinckia sp. L45]
MISKRRGWMLLGVSALCLCAIAPSRVADGRLPRWTNIFWDIRQGASRVADLTHDLVGRLHLPSHDSAPPIRTASAPPPEVVATAPILGTLNAVQAASVLNQAFAAAVATERLKELGFEAAPIRDALTAYRAGDLAAGDAAARNASDPIVQTALEWVALRIVSGKIGMERLTAFTTAHPDWPSQTWFRHQVEARLFRSQDTAVIRSFFAASPPQTPLGKMALARAWKADGHAADAVRMIRALYRESDLTSFLETKLKADYGSDLQKADYKYRADRLLYKEDVGAAMRVAALAGPDVVALAKARAAVIAEAPSDKVIAAVPAPLRNDPGLLLAQIQKLRRSDKLKEAAAAMLAAPRDPAILINGDEWWTERRLLARKILDTGDAQTAYRICAGHSAQSTEARIEAEFHAGWIALRFLNDPVTATRHFATAAQYAETPTSLARVAYWQGRATENATDPDALIRAKAFYEKAAQQTSTYYGQLARIALGLKPEVVQAPAIAAKGTDRAEAVRVIEILYAAGEKDSAYALAADAAQNIKDDAQVAALAKVINGQQDAHLALTIGKMMALRGMPVDSLAFPTFGIPHFEPLVNSASASVVYSVARQESAFNSTVVSGAGAKGLMQMIDSTAKRTATRAGLPFDETRLLTDAAFNAQLGAAHLGALMAEQGNSYILTFAAYNAGGGRVKEWINAYGDPRNPGVDAVDWVERIPFTETRNYVQRVMANVTMYQARFADEAAKSEAALAGNDGRAKL